MALVVPFVRALGYDPNSPREVRLEYCADFAQADGKKFPDRMDFAIFDKNGQKPLMVIETKPLGTNLQSNSFQLARYVSQLPELHFGIITDDTTISSLDWRRPIAWARNHSSRFRWMMRIRTGEGQVSRKFSREAFNAETLVTDAEDSRYREAMIQKLVGTLKNPSTDENFMRWISKDIYKGRLTEPVMKRLGELAKESIEPAILRLMSSDFLEKLKERMKRLQDDETGSPQENMSSTELKPAPGPLSLEDTSKERKSAIVTTEEELEFYSLVSDVCAQAGYSREEILWRDTTNYFNVSHKRPTRWFVRFFSLKDQKAIVTHVPVDVATSMCAGYRVEEAPSVFGTSRIYFDSVSQVWALKDVILASLRATETTPEAEVGNSE